MALTGLFLCTFLVVHLIGNLQLLIDDHGYQFNNYARFMTSNPFIKVAGYITYLSILFHAAKGLWLAARNRSARPKGYKKYSGSANSTWMSRSMGVLGTIILVFIIIHMQQFWYQYKYAKTEIPSQEYFYLANGNDHLVILKDSIESALDGEDTTLNKFIDPMAGRPTFGTEVKSVKIKDLYTVVADTYKDPLYVALYVLAMVSIGFHLLHGFSSAFQTMGWKHPKYNGLINLFTWFFGIIIPAGFAAIPLIMYFR